MLEKPTVIRFLAAAVCLLLIGSTCASCMGAGGDGSTSVNSESSDGHPDLIEKEPAQEDLIAFALAHVERLGLLAGANDMTEFRENHEVQVLRASAAHPDGAWLVLFKGKRFSSDLWLTVSSRGKLLGFQYFWPVLSDEGPSEAEQAEPMEQAVEQALREIRVFRGAIPDDVVLILHDLRQPDELRSVSLWNHRTPYWRLRWQQADAVADYPYSYIDAIFSERHGIVSYTDQYLGLRTKHEPKIDREEALTLADAVMEDSVLSRYEGRVLGKQLLYAERPHAYVWQIPGDHGDILVYAFSWRAMVRVDEDEESLRRGMFYIDAVTGKQVDIGPSPGASWQFGQTRRQDQPRE